MIVERCSLRKKCPYSEFFWSVFSHIWTEYGDSLFDSVVILENPGKRKPLLWYVLDSDIFLKDAFRNNSIPI